MNIISYQSLSNYNTFKINAKAKQFVNIQTETDLIKLLNQKETKNIKITILGGGSNILLTKNIEGLVIHNQIKGIKVINSNTKYVFIEVGAGVVWDKLVQWSTDEKLFGLENLSLIPGYVGASPIQNIGAYGVELKDVFEELRAINLTTKQIKVFKKSECEFGYRDSVFKNKLKEKYLISKITIKLSKNQILTTSYKGLKQKIKSYKKEELTSELIREKIIEIRNTKLPNPKNIGNAGSFFKNPIISKELLNSIQIKYPKVPFFQNNESFKISAGWLIEKLNWRGYREKKCGVSSKHALVIVNYGNATGKDILILSKKIKDNVQKKFNIKLEEEVSIL
ncbi:UDP-N-acetylmuramate dehydrogenase [Flavobacteriales bacterium]|nr:UDP-N-acetylmuramate dehydrogenase [Flavobacteriales bacterium]